MCRLPSFLGSPNTVSWPVAFLSVPSLCHYIRLGCMAGCLPVCSITLPLHQAGVHGRLPSCLFHHFATAPGWGAWPVAFLSVPSLCHCIRLGCMAGCLPVCSITLPLHQAGVHGRLPSCLFHHFATASGWGAWPVAFLSVPSLCHCIRLGCMAGCLPVCSITLPLHQAGVHGRLPSCLFHHFATASGWGAWPVAFLSVPSLCHCIRLGCMAGCLPVCSITLPLHQAGVHGRLPSCLFHHFATASGWGAWPVAFLSVPSLCHCTRLLACFLFHHSKLMKTGGPMYNEPFSLHNSCFMKC